MILEPAYVVLGIVLCFDTESHVRSIVITAISTKINTFHVSNAERTSKICEACNTKSDF